MDPGDPMIWQLPERPARGKHLQVHRWEPWVRSYLCAQTLISSLSFTVHDRPDRPLSVSMQTWVPGMRKRHELVQLVCPPEELFHEQVLKVLDWADLREERIPEVLTQIGNTYAFWGALVPLHTERMRHTREVLDAAVQFAMFVEMRFKHELACWRPVDYSPQVQPMVSTPGHGSMPCGHCVEAYVIKEVLEGLLGFSDVPSQAQIQLHEQFERTAARISTNRVVAGIHFPVDNVAGRLLGTALGRYFVFLCKGTAKKGSEFVGATRVFSGNTCPPQIEFEPDWQPLDMLAGVYHSKASRFPDIEPQDSVLTVLWQAAREELHRLQLPFR
jgi:hypothetical protein